MFNCKNNYLDFDIILFYFVLRNLCNFKCYLIGWGRDLDLNDWIVLVNIDRICLLKNIYKLYKLGIDILDLDFNMVCDEILKSIFDLEMYLGNKINY